MDFKSRKLLLSWENSKLPLSLTEEDTTRNGLKKSCMNINPIVLSIPVFFILIGIELVIERFSHQKFYRLQDAIANLSCGITSQLSGLFLKIFGIGVYEFLFEHFALFTLDRNWLYWV